MVVVAVAVIVVVVVDLGSSDEGPRMERTPSLRRLVGEATRDAAHLVQQRPVSRGMGSQWAVNGRSMGGKNDPGLLSLSLSLSLFLSLNALTFW
jgi:hypothetical protein